MVKKYLFHSKSRKHTPLNFRGIVVYILMDGSRSGYESDYVTVKSLLLFYTLKLNCV